MPSFGRVFTRASPEAEACYRPASASVEQGRTMPRSSKLSTPAPSAPASPKAPAKATRKKSGANSAPEPAPAEADRDADAAVAAREVFLNDQRGLLLAERANYSKQADELKAQADSLALEHEPGDVQFDEEGGEGGTSNVDRELDLVLSAQARAAILEIDRALEKLEAGTYGRCERCGQDIPVARLQAVPHASLCVACKSGGLSSRR
jgi:DnaK suppressor protein